MPIGQFYSLTVHTEIGVARGNWSAEVGTGSSSRTIQSCIDEIYSNKGIPTKEGYTIGGYTDYDGDDVDVSKTRGEYGGLTCSVYIKWELIPIVPPVIIHGSVGTRKAIQTITPPWTPKTYNELVAMDVDSAVAELNTNAEGYYNHFKDTNLYKSMMNAWMSSDGTMGGVTKRGSYRIRCFYSTGGEFLDDWEKTTSAPAP